MNPIEEFLQECEKSAGFIDSPGVPATLGRRGMDAMVQGLGAGIGAAALGAGAIAVKEIYDAATTGRDFRSMMSWHGDLKGEDQKHVLQAFKTLRRFAPDMSKDPLVSGSVVRQMVQMPNGTSVAVQGLISAQKNLGHPVRDSFIREAGGSVSKGMQGMNPLEMLHQVQAHEPGPVDQHNRAMGVPAGRQPEASRDRSEQKGPRNWSVDRLNQQLGAGR